jgi:putative transposase
MSRPVRKGAHTVYELKVHLVWVTKYRYHVLKGEVGLRIRELLRQGCDAHDIQIIKGRVSRDHVHLYISYPPTLSVSEIMRRLKGRSSRKIQQEYPHLKKRYWGRHFWAIGYAAFSSGHVTDEMIQDYLERHADHPNHNNDDFVVEP